MGWILGIIAIAYLAWQFSRALNAQAMRSAERQMAAADPEGYRLAMAYRESQKPENRAKAAALLEEQLIEAERIRTSPLTPVSATSIILKNGEIAYWEELCESYREQSLQEFGMAGRGNVSYDVGKLVVTDRRVVFVGAKATVEIWLERVVLLVQNDSSFTISVANGKTRLLGTGNPRAGAVIARVLETKFGVASGALQAESVESEPVRIELEMQITGATDQVSGYMDELANRLQSEIDVRQARAHWDARSGSVEVSPSLFTSAVRQASKRMSHVVEEVERRFSIAAAKPGQTEAIRAPYAKLADGILDGMESFWKMKPPTEFADAYREYCAMLRSMYEQLAAWPSQIREAAAGVDALGCDMKLRIEYDASTLHRTARNGGFPPGGDGDR